MGLIDFILGTLAAIVAGVAIRVLSEDARAWLPRFTATVKSAAVRKLPDSRKERMAEEWEAHLQEIPGDFSRFVVSCNFWLASWAIRRAGAPGSTERYLQSLPWYKRTPIRLAGRVVANLVVWDYVSRLGTDHGRLRLELRQFLRTALVSPVYYSATVALGSGHSLHEAVVRGRKTTSTVTGGLADMLLDIRRSNGEFKSNAERIMLVRLLPDGTVAVEINEDSSSDGTSEMRSEQHQFGS